MKIYFATGNSGKVEHLQNILTGFEVVQLDVDTVEPQSESLEEIVTAKIEQAVEKVDTVEDGFLIADDSGLFLDSLNGFPGAYSAPFDKMVGKEKLLDLIDGDNSAEFRAAIGLYDDNGEVEVFKGTIEGEIVEPRGDGGFGYDPMFLPDGSEETWGEDPGQKDENSHRQKAVEKLVEFLEQSL